MTSSTSNEFTVLLQVKLPKQNGGTFETRTWNTWNRCRQWSQHTRSTEIGSGSSRCLFWRSSSEETNSKWTFFMPSTFVAAISIKYFFILFCVLVQCLTLVSLSVYRCVGFTSSQSDMVTIFCRHYRLEGKFFSYLNEGCQIWRITLPAVADTAFKSSNEKCCHFQKYLSVLTIPTCQANLSGGLVKKIFCILMVSIFWLLWCPKCNLFLK